MKAVTTLTGLTPARVTAIEEFQRTGDEKLLNAVGLKIATTIHDEVLLEEKGAMTELSEDIWLAQHGTELRQRILLRLVQYKQALEKWKAAQPGAATAASIVRFKTAINELEWVLRGGKDE